MMYIRRYLCLSALLLAICTASMAKEVKDTLYSSNGDRVILSYNMTQDGGQVTVKFNTVQKKLGQRTQDKYKKLDEVAVVIFDRTGNYRDLKFDGQTPNAFMVPAGVSYTPSSDGYFLLQEEPVLQFSVKQGEEAELSIPLYLAHYEGKRHYKIFGQCGQLKLKPKQSKVRGAGGAMAGGGGGGQGVDGETTITTEELTDEGLSPADEAAIRASSAMSMIEKAKKLPFSEELKHEISALSDLRFKVTDPDVSKQIAQTLEAYSNKKEELEAEAEKAEKEAAEKADQLAKDAKALTDSLSAESVLQAAKDKKDLMWLIGGIGGLALLLFGGKQVYKAIKDSQMQKAQKQMMEGITKMARGGMEDVNAANPFGSIPGMKQAEQAVTGKAQRALSKEAEAAKKRLQEMKKKPEGNGNPNVNPNANDNLNAKPKKPSLNDQIPAKYKRWRKPGQNPPNNNVTI